jgi:hypothetical protein
MSPSKGNRQKANAVRIGGRFVPDDRLERSPLSAHLGAVTANVLERGCDRRNDSEVAVCPQPTRWLKSGK